MMYDWILYGFIWCLQEVKVFQSGHLNYIGLMKVLQTILQPVSALKEDQYLQVTQQVQVMVRWRQLNMTWKQDRVRIGVDFVV